MRPFFLFSLFTSAYVAGVQFDFTKAHQKLHVWTLTVAKRALETSLVFKHYSICWNFIKIPQSQKLDSILSEIYALLVFLTSKNITVLPPNSCENFTQATLRRQGIRCSEKRKLIEWGLHCVGEDNETILTPEQHYKASDGEPQLSVNDPSRQHRRRIALHIFPRTFSHYDYASPWIAFPWFGWIELWTNLRYQLLAPTQSTVVEKVRWFDLLLMVESAAVDWPAAGKVDLWVEQGGRRDWNEIKYC